MKKVLFIVCVLLSSTVYAEMKATITDVFEDPIRPGIIVVETQYREDGVLIQTGRTRYNQDSGRNQDIIDRAKFDIDDHINALFLRVDDNDTFVNTTKENRTNELKRDVNSIVTPVKASLVGYEKIESSKVIEYKGKEIELFTDKAPIYRNAPVRP